MNPVDRAKFLDGLLTALRGRSFMVRVSADVADEGPKAPVDVITVENAYKTMAEASSTLTTLPALGGASPSSSSAASWIPVGERLPSPHTDDDFIIASSTGFVGALKFGESGWREPEYDTVDNHPMLEDPDYWNRFVTHWMPMPDAPLPQGDASK